jgi:hypothetical protein
MATISWHLGSRAYCCVFPPSSSRNTFSLRSSALGHKNDSL